MVDLDIPYSDAKEISFLIEKNIDRKKVSTSIVLDQMDEMYDAILASQKIEVVTKDLIKILLRK